MRTLCNPYILPVEGVVNMAHMRSGQNSLYTASPEKTRNLKVRPSSAPVLFQGPPSGSMFVFWSAVALKQGCHMTLCNKGVLTMAHIAMSFVCKDMPHFQWCVRKDHETKRTPIGCNHGADRAATYNEQSVF